jgi:hypothetical protein
LLLLASSSSSIKRGKVNAIRVGMRVEDKQELEEIEKKW